MHKSDFPSSPDPSLHGTFYPEDIYPGDGITAFISPHDDERDTRNFKIWRLSPLGVDLNAEDQEEIPSLHTKIRLVISVGETRSSLHGVVSSIESIDGRKIVSVRFVDDQEDTVDSTEERRSQPRWICSEQFFPTCVWTHPARFNEFVYARIKDASPDGFRLSTSLRNKYLVKGSSFSAIVNLPMIGQFQCDLEIQNLEIESVGVKESLSLGVKIKGIDSKERRKIGQYLNQFGVNTSPRELARFGMSPGSVKNSISFGFVRTETEYTEVLELRQRTYSSAKKVPENQSAEQMGTKYDSRSRILTAHYKDQLVATACLVFHEYHDEFEIEESTSWPASFPRKEQSVEVIRTCTHPSFRGSDLLLSLFHQIALTVAQAGRRYIVFGSTPGLLPLYTNLGMEATGHRYNHKTLGNTEHEIVIGDIPLVLSGATLNPVYWNAVWGDLTEHVMQGDYLQFNQLDLIRIRVYRLFRPLAWLTRRWMRKPRMLPT